MIPNEKCPCLNCSFCKSNGFDLFCIAFPDGVPDEIIEGENDHSTPLPDQENDIVFEPVKN